jgi:aryl-alcohol dehydrogenase-like predicted oxidoreductase
MQQRLAPRLGRTVSAIGLGTWQLGAEWGEVSDVEADAILDAAFEHGIDFLDTADIYGGGRSERRIGKRLAGIDRPIFVATKLGRRSDPGWPHNFEYDTMRRHAEESRERLGVAALDLLQLHCVPTEVLREGRIFDHLRRLQADGILRAFGASVESSEQARICLTQPDLASLQIIFNVLRQTPIETIFDAARRQGVAIIVRLPLASGLLAGKFRADTRFGDDDHRNYNRDGEAFHAGETFAGLPFDRGLAIVEELRALVPVDMTLATMSQRWILDHDAVTTVITGATRRAQVVENASCAALPPLPASLHARLREIWAARVRGMVRGQD